MRYTNRRLLDFFISHGHYGLFHLRMPSSDVTNGKSYHW